ncbi:hypothetical protein Droror1_Dr00005739 [Drosera rotundifolia]
MIPLTSRDGFRERVETRRGRDNTRPQTASQVWLTKSFHTLLVTNPRQKISSSATMAVESDAMSRIDDDILQNIQSKLPAPSFASAAYVSRTWNAVCSCVLSRPLLVSALLLNPSLEDAVEEIVEKVLARPMRPMFAIMLFVE